MYQARPCPEGARPSAILAAHDGEGAVATHAGGNQKKRWSIQARPLAVTIQPVVKEEDFWM